METAPRPLLPIPWLATYSRLKVVHHIGERSYTVHDTLAGVRGLEALPLWPARFV